jgi:hypothetical protein
MEVVSCEKLEAVAAMRVTPGSTRVPIQFRARQLSGVRSGSVDRGARRPGEERRGVGEGGSQVGSRRVSLERPHGQRGIHSQVRGRGHSGRVPPQRLPRIRLAGPRRALRTGSLRTQRASGRAERGGPRSRRVGASGAAPSWLAAGGHIRPRDAAAMPERPACEHS